MHSAVVEFLSSVLPKQHQGFRYNPVQVAYSGSISQALASGPEKFHFVEGDTGIGKSLAYLITLGDWIARGKHINRKGVVSTHSRALQRQLAGAENQQLLDAYLKWQGLPPVILSVRMGKKNYVCRDRLARALQANDLVEVALDNDRPALDRGLAQWALETEGCLLDLSDADYPEDIALEDIALGDGDPVPEALATHFSEVQAADIQIINHALLTMDLVTDQSITKTTEPSVILLDEAEHFPAVAQQLLSRRLSFGVARSVLHALGQNKAADAWRDLHTRYRDPDFGRKAHAVRSAQAIELTAGLQAIIEAKPRRVRLEDHSLRQDWERLRSDAFALIDAMGEQSHRLALSYSPIKGLPSLVYHNSAGGGVLKAAASKRVTILTSATLSDLGHGFGEQPSFTYLRGELVLSANDNRLGLQRSHQAFNFGDIRFSFPQVPVAPLTKRGGYDEFTLHPQYVSSAWEALEIPVSGRTLVLCVSYADVDAMLKACPAVMSSRVATHGRGANISQLAEEMPNDGILLTPAGWEGLSPAREGVGAFWARVVLLRNPTPRPDPIEELALARHYMKAHPEQIAYSKAQAGIMYRGQVRTVHKIRQGLGRAIRHPDDIVELFILDPRFPRPHGVIPAGVRASPRLLGAIPFRFLGAYEEGEVIGESISPESVLIL